MEIAKILSRIPADFIADVSLSDPEADIDSLSLLTPNNFTQREGVLYFGDNALVPDKRLPDMLFNCVLAGGDPIPESLLQDDSANVVALRQDVDPLVCYNMLQAVFLEDRKVISVVQRMLSALFSNRGLQYLVEETARILGHPIVVVDINHRYIAYHLGDLEGSDTPLGQAMAEELILGMLDDKAASYIRDQGIDSQIARDGVYDGFNHMLGTRTFTTAVIINDICVAHVMMLESQSPLTEVDRECLLRLQQFVGQELQKQALYGHSTGERGSFFLASLLEDDHPSEAVTVRRLRELNFHPKPEFHVLVMQVSGEGLDQTEVEMIAAQLRATLHHSLYTRHRRKFVALLSRDVGQGVGEESLRQIGEVAALNGLKVGISNPYGLLSETHTAYREARAAVNYGSLNCSAAIDGAVYWYRDQVPLRILDIAVKRTTLLPLCHPALRAVQAYDEQHDTELLDTLFVYLQCAGSAQRAAQLLNLHKNTMLYRLGRIRELLAPIASLNSGEDRFLLQLGFRILMFGGYFTPRIALDREELRKG